MLAGSLSLAAMKCDHALPCFQALLSERSICVKNQRRFSLYDHANPAASYSAPSVACIVVSGRKLTRGPLALCLLVRLIVGVLARYRIGMLHLLGLRHVGVFRADPQPVWLRCKGWWWCCGRRS